jgi:hypothetical protein
MVEANEEKSRRFIIVSVDWESEEVGRNGGPGRRRIPKKNVTLVLDALGIGGQVPASSSRISRGIIRSVILSQASVNPIAVSASRGAGVLASLNI